jgi:hypothetical protein
VGNRFWSKYLDWVLQRTNEIHHVVGVSCMSYEEQFMAILIVIEAGHPQMVLGSTSKLGSKGIMLYKL